MKRFLSLMLVFLMILSFAFGGGTGEASDDGKIDLRVSWWGGDARHEKYRQMLDHYEELHPEVNIIREFAGFDGYFDKLTVQAASGSMPDVVHMHLTKVADYASRGALLPLDEYVESGIIDLSEFNQAIIDSGKVDGKIYIVYHRNASPTNLSSAERCVAADELRWVSIKDKDGNVLVKADHMITPRRAEQVIRYGVNEDGSAPITKVKIRTILTCKSRIGICAKCYGANMATGEPVQVGEAVGIIAAQSIGEPGTQLTMRTFHTGGVAGDDITQGLPRVEELFEARKPKGLAIITEFGGVATINDTKKKREVIVTNQETGESKAYLIPYGSRIKVTDGAVLEAGDELTEGSINPHDLLKIKGLRAAQDYMIQEVQRVYRLQGVDINDKHIEVIVRQMLKKIRIEEHGDSDFLPGTMVDILEFNDVNKKLEEEGKEPATGEQVMLGITKASLATNSFLSAASFQETTKVLTEAAIKGKVDPLIGLKENVLIGKLIPAGTGMSKYRNVKLDTGVAPEGEVSIDELEEEETADTFTEETEESPVSGESAGEEGTEGEAAQEEVPELTLS